MLKTLYSETSIKRTPNWADTLYQADTKPSPKINVLYFPL